MIEISDLSVRLSGKQVLHGVGFEARAGQLTAIVGPNGSGKTTSMKAIAGELPYGGTVSINGHDISTLKPLGTRLAAASCRNRPLSPFPLRCAKSLRMGLGPAAGTQPARLKPTIADALEAVDLDGFAGRFYQELSGGEQQRVQLARALCQMRAGGQRRTGLLLLDEPVSSLDIRHQLTIMRLARGFCERGGGVIAIMHDLNLTAMFADRIALLTAGGLLAAGAIADVVTDDRLAAAFGCRLAVNQTPKAGGIFVLPHSAV